MSIIKKQAVHELIRLLEEGQSIALVSDAGLPAISDPGADLVGDAARTIDCRCSDSGGECRIVSTYRVGPPTDRFLFAGFPPRERKPLATGWIVCIKRSNDNLL